MRDITYCSQTFCAHLDCVRHQYNAPLSDNLSIADLNDGLCFDPMEYIPDDSELPLYDECESAVSVKPITSTIDLSEAEKRLSGVQAMYATNCLVCGTEVPVYYLGGGPQVCNDCKKTIKFIKEKFNKELDNYEV
jgi:hypothetical protein